MNNNGIVYVLINNGYQIVNCNVPFIKFFCKKSGEEEMGVIGCIDGTAMYDLDSEQLDNIAFQIERKFLLSGIKSVEILFLIYSDNIERDKKYTEGKTKYWLIDTLTNRLVIFENQPEDFWGIRLQIERALYNINEKIIEKKKTNVRNWPWITIVLILINLIYYIYLEINGSTENPMYMLSKGALYYKNVFEKHEIYRLITCMFMHYGIAHLFNNMFGLALLGHEAEKFYGKFCFIVIYIFSGIIGNIASIYYFRHMGTYAVAAGASGAIYGITGALLVKIIEEKRKSKSAVGKIIIVLFVLYGAGSGVGNVDNVAHIGGLISGFILGSLSYFLLGNKAKSNR